MALGVDTSSSTNFHIDVWSADLSSFKIKIVDFGADGAYGWGDLDGPEGGSIISWEIASSFYEQEYINIRFNLFILSHILFAFQI